MRDGKPRSKKYISYYKKIALDVETLKRMDTMNEKNYPMTMGISDMGEWITQQFLFDMVNRGEVSICSETRWTYSGRRSHVTDWIEKEFYEYRRVSTSARSIFIWFGDDCLINFYISSSMITCYIHGNPSKAKSILSEMKKSPFPSAESTIDWIHADDGSTVSVPLRNRPLIQAAYPWVERGVNNYIDEYLKADESVLILIGPPGTGKTSFIRHMILQAEASAQVTYEEKIMSSDSLFANWIDSNEQFMVLEDSDAFLAARSDGNRMMHKFLNVSEGLITVAGKKMIFSTNLPNIKDIDEALMRKGRCFGVLDFRALDFNESCAVLDEIGSDREIDRDRKYTLAELFTNGVTETPKVKKAGFGFA